MKTFSVWFLIPLNMYCFLWLSLGATLQFDSKKSTIYFSTDNSLFRSTPDHVYGWQDGSIRRRVSAFGNYDLMFLDSDNNKIISYFETSPDEFLYSDFVLTASSVSHITFDTVFDLHGKVMQIEDNAQLFVDSDVTLTIRNATIQFRNNALTFPPIRLASLGSKLALDNVTLSLSDDFNFMRGQLFIHNKVTMAGPSHFVYRSTQPSFITSGGLLLFDQGSTFSFVPATAGVVDDLANDLIHMNDAASALSLNGASLELSHTGLRITKGSVVLDNVVTFKNGIGDTINEASITGGIVDSFSGYQSFGVQARSVSWSPDGRYLVVGTGVAGSSTTDGLVEVYRFTALSGTGGLSEVGSGHTVFGGSVKSVKSRYLT